VSGHPRWPRPLGQLFCGAIPHTVLLTNFTNGNAAGCRMFTRDKETELSKVRNKEVNSTKVSSLSVSIPWTD